MAARIGLHSSLAQIDLLYRQEDRPRSSARQVMVDRAALKAVLMDHALMSRRLHELGEIEPNEADGPRRPQEAA